MKARLLVALLALAACVLAAACGAAGTHAGGAAPGDAGSPVRSGAEGGSPSGSGGTSVDAGGADAAPDDDAGEPEAAAADDAVADAGAALDAAAASSPAVTCADALGDVYVTPAGLPTMTMNARGAVVRCAFDRTLATNDIAADFTTKSVAGLVPTTGTNVYRIAYRTYRDDGVPGVSTARVYLPQTPRSLPLPVVAVAHPTEGLAASCTPSQDPTSLEDEALPWASQGFAVVASDYAGLGNGGVQGYLDNHDQAHSMLDSARALRALLAPGVLDDRVLLVGYSQGGGAVLASQGLAASYGAGGNVVAVVVFAAEYVSRVGSLQLVQTLGSPGNLTISTGITVPVVTAMRNYAFGYNVLGPDASTATFQAGNAAGIQNALETLCQVPFGGYIQGVAPHVGDIFDDGFRASLLACIQGGSADAGDGGGVTASTADGGVAACSGLGAQYYQWLASDLVAPDPAGAPVLYVQGLADTIMPPAQEAACNIGLLRDAGVPVQVCTDPAASHTDVVARNVPFALAWADTKLYGGAAPACSSAGLPACAP